MEGLWPRKRERWVGRQWGSPGEKVRSSRKQISKQKQIHSIHLSPCELLFPGTQIRYKVYRGRREGNGHVKQARPPQPGALSSLMTQWLISQFPDRCKLFAQGPLIKLRCRNINIFLKPSGDCVSSLLNGSAQTVFNHKGPVLLLGFCHYSVGQGPMGAPGAHGTHPGTGEGELRVVLAKQVTASWKHIHFWMGQRTDGHKCCTGSSAFVPPCTPLIPDTMAPTWACLRVIFLSHMEFSLHILLKQHLFPGQRVRVEHQSSWVYGCPLHGALNQTSCSVQAFAFEYLYPSFAPSTEEHLKLQKSRLGLLWVLSEKPAQETLLTFLICKLQRTLGTPTGWYLSFSVLVKNKMEHKRCSNNLAVGVRQHISLWFLGPQPGLILGTHDVNPHSEVLVRFCK